MAGFVARVDGSTDRASGWCDRLIPCAAESIERSASSSKKTRMCILPHFHPSTVPDDPRRLVPRRPGAIPSTPRRSGSSPETRRKRHEKPPCPPCPPCETQSFADPRLRNEKARRERVPPGLYPQPHAVSRCTMSRTCSMQLRRDGRSRKPGPCRGITASPSQPPTRPRAWPRTPPYAPMLRRGRAGAARHFRQVVRWHGTRLVQSRTRCSSPGTSSMRMRTFPASNAYGTSCPAASAR
jgi:hypothetical protein